VIKPMDRHTIHILSSGGMSHVAIAQHVGVSVRSVQRVLHESEPQLREIGRDRMDGRHGGRASPTAALRSRLTEYFSDEKRTAVPTTELLRIASTEWDYAGSRATFFRLVRSLRPAAVPEPMVRFEGLPGEFAQFDFGEAKVAFSDGHRKIVHIFVGRLKYSRMLHVFIVPDEQAETLIRCVVGCCQRWGGSPMAWVFDNPKTVRLSRGNEPIRLHPYLQHLAAELRAAVELCSPRSGNQKGSVERGVGWVKNSFLLVRSFVDMNDLQAQLAEWLVAVNMVRPCDATKEIPAVLLKREAPRLAERPVAWTEDSYALHESLQVTPVATVVYRTTPYQVDPRAIGTVATALVRRQTIEIHTVRDTRCTHVRRDGERAVQRLPGQATDVLSRLHGERKQNYFKRECILALGEPAQLFLEEVIHSHVNGRWAPLVHRLFALLEERGADRLRDALARCVAAGRFNLFAVHAALKESA
jgi:transposase